MSVVYAVMDTPIGSLLLAATEKGVCHVGLPGEGWETFSAWLVEHVSPDPPHENPDALRDPIIQLREYFSRLRRHFEVPLDLRGTPFRQAVWSEVAAIPYGTTTTYGAIARRMGRGRAAARAVGAAVGANPVPILIPCHRVVGADGSPVGYRGGLKIKEALLRLEGAWPGR